MATSFPIQEQQCNQGINKHVTHCAENFVGWGRGRALIGGLAVVAFWRSPHMGRLVLGRPGPVTHKEERGKKREKGEKEERKKEEERKGKREKRKKGRRFETNMGRLFRV